MAKKLPSNSANPQDIVVMARVGAPFGIKGWLKLQVFTQTPDSLDAYASWLLKSDGKGNAGWEEFELEDFSVNAKGVIAKLKGCDDRTAAEKLVKRDIGIPREALDETGEGEIFWFDLIGCEVVNTAGEVFGSVETLLETGANDVLVVRNAKIAGSGGESGEMLIPYIDEVVVKVDREAKRITVNWSGEFQ